MMANGACEELCSKPATAGGGEGFGLSLDFPIFTAVEDVDVKLGIPFAALVSHLFFKFEISFYIPLGK